MTISHKRLITPPRRVQRRACVKVNKLTYGIHAALARAERRFLRWPTRLPRTANHRDH